MNIIRCGRCQTYRDETCFTPSQRKTGANCKECAKEVNRLWRANNPEKAEQLRQRQYANYKRKKEGTVRITTRTVKWKPTDPDGIVIEQLLTNARNRARITGITFDLSAEDIAIPTNCPVLGIPLSFGVGHKNRDNAPSIDRIYNDEGYTPDNIVIISWRANWLKNNATIDELRLLAKFYGDLDDRLKGKKEVISPDRLSLSQK